MEVEESETDANSPEDKTSEPEPPPEDAPEILLDSIEEPDVPPICPFVTIDSNTTVVDESEEFPEPVEPLERLAWEPEPETKRSFANLYVSECYKYGVTPLSYITELLTAVDSSPDEPVEIDLNRFGCSNLQVQIIFDCLYQACPGQLRLLDVSHNLLMDASLAVSLANLLQASQTIVDLNLSNSNMDHEVMSILSRALSSSSVQKLGMAHCHLSDGSGELLFQELVLSDCIREVDVSWNRLEHRSGVAIGTFLAGNASCEKLNLEGNYLYLEKQCIVPMLKELCKNVTLKQLNLAWNGLHGSLFGQTLHKALTSCGLEVLNLEMNSMRSDEADSLIKALRKSESLKEIHIGGNFFTEVELKDLVKAFGRNQSIKHLSLGKYQFISKVAGRLAKRCMTRDDSKSVLFQGILLANPPRPVDLHEMLLDRCRFLGFKPKRKKRKRNLGHFMLQLQKLENLLLTRDDFVAQVKKFRIKLDQNLLRALMDAFADRKLVDCGAMATKYLTKYPTEPPPVKRKKAKKKKKK
ncbi:uncharacterized protein LOC129763090, partial [Toxorhynchites rutilus septentrionalis]|uniref:uncharacterized protein LOC129763090 n=1 Tax=Toxorhynchites rutilus septentrionalis TaxID=329112 RepID=UPI002479D9F9